MSSFFVSCQCSRFGGYWLGALFCLAVPCFFAFVCLFFFLRAYAKQIDLDGDSIPLNFSSRVVFFVIYFEVVGSRTLLGSHHLVAMVILLAMGLESVCAQYPAGTCLGLLFYWRCFCCLLRVVISSGWEQKPDEGAGLTVDEHGD